MPRGEKKAFLGGIWLGCDHRELQNVLFAGHAPWPAHARVYFCSALAEKSELFEVAIIL
jgi:hypothetical protein